MQRFLLMVNLCARMHSTGAHWHSPWRSGLPAFVPPFSDARLPRPCRQVSCLHERYVHARQLHHRTAGRTRCISYAVRDRGVGGGEGMPRRDIRVFIQQPFSANEGGYVEFSQEQGHYLRTVMRVTEGTEIKVFDGTNGEW
jgi:hypothetical protein